MVRLRAFRTLGLFMVITPVLPTFSRRTSGSAWLDICRAETGNLYRNISKTLKDKHISTSTDPGNEEAVQPNVGDQDPGGSLMPNTLQILIVWRSSGSTLIGLLNHLNKSGRRSWFDPADSAAQPLNRLWTPDWQQYLALILEKFSTAVNPWCSSTCCRYLKLSLDVIWGWLGFKVITFCICWPYFLLWRLKPVHSSAVGSPHFCQQILVCVVLLLITSLSFFKLNDIKTNFSLAPSLQLILQTYGSPL